MKIVALFGLVMMSPFVMAQTAGSCSQSLRLARSVYDKGRLQEIPAILQNCLHKSGGFTKTERVETFRLLTLSYLYSDEPEKANQGMLDLLKEFHYYKPNREVDPAEYVALFNTFRTTPIYRLGLKAGINATKPHVVSSTLANRSADRDSSGYAGFKSGISYMIGATAEIPVVKNVVFNPELYFFARSFSGSNAQPGVQEVQLLSESLNALSLPLTLQYTVNRGWSATPYVGLGLSINYLLKSERQLQINRYHSQSIESQLYRITPYQNRISFDALVTLGSKFGLGPGQLILEMRYWMGISKVNSENQTFGDSNALWNHHYAAPIVRTGTGSFTIGYMVDMFKPKKKGMPSRRQ